jgi:nucleotide-binding universal stress UspA family protein
VDGVRRKRATVAVGYRSILVPVADNAESEKAVDVACRLSAERGASIIAVAVIEVPSVLPLDAHMLEEEADARRVLTRAAAIGDSYGIRVSPRTVRGREAAAAIVDQAAATRCELIVIGAPRKRRFGNRAFVFGRTGEAVLKKAPCRVMVIAAPSEAADARVVSAA